MTEGRIMKVVLRNGHNLRGRIRNVGRYSIELTNEDGICLLFKHAIQLVREERRNPDETR